MVMDLPMVPPPTPSDNNRPESHMQVPPPETRPLIEAIMPSLTTNSDTVLIAKGDKATAQMDKAETLSTTGFKSIDLPDGWNVKELSAPPPGYCHEAKSGNASITLFSTGRSLGEDAEAAFRKTIDSAAGKTKMLFDSTWEKSPSYQNDPARQKQIADQIKELRGALGHTQLGDNQFTNQAKPPDPKAPAFHIDRLEVQTVNGKQVLAVEGHYTSIKDGSPERYYSGILAPTENDDRATTIHQVSLESADKMNFMANKAPFRKTLSSIEW